MALYAIEALDDSFRATREFLTSPPSIKRWLVLAVVVFFMGGTSSGSGFGSGSFNAGSDVTTAPTTGPPIEEVFGELTDVILANLGLIFLGLGILLVIGLTFSFVAAIMEFVFIQSLRTDEVRVFDYAGAHLRKAIGLFVFRLVLGLIGLVVFVGIAYMAYVSIVDAETIPLATISLLVFVGIVFGLTLSLIDGFTTSFVVPVMLVRDSGVIEGWRRFATPLVDSWVQYLAYLIAAFVLRLAIGIIVSIVMGFVAIVLLVPLAIVGISAFAILGTEPAGIAILILLVVVFIALLLPIGAILQVPVESYLRYYAMFVLGSTDPDVDPIVEMRARVRREPDGADEPTGASP